MKQFYTMDILAALLKRSALSCCLGAIWHTNVLKCCQEVQITVSFQMPPLLPVCRVNIPWVKLGQGGMALRLVITLEETNITGTAPTTIIIPNFLRVPVRLFQFPAMSAVCVLPIAQWQASYHFCAAAKQHWGCYNISCHRITSSVPAFQE